MTREKFLTVRWNNTLTLALGMPGLIFVAFALSSSAWSESAELLGLGVIGVIY